MRLVGLFSTCAIALSVVSSAQAQQSYPLAAMAQAIPKVAPADDAAAPTEPAQHLAVDDRQSRALWSDLAALSTMLPVLAEARSTPLPDAPRWSGGILMDGWMNKRLSQSGSTASGVAHASDVLLYGSMAYPVLIDNLFRQMVRDRDPELSLRLLAVDMQAYTMTGIMVSAAKVNTSRERPDAHAAGCSQGSMDAEECDKGRNVSFFSGHTAVAFTGAGLVCYHQTEYNRRDRSGSAAACGFSLGAASATGLFRVLANRHWPSDVLVGAGVGLTSGLLLPTLTGGRPLVGGTDGKFSWRVTPYAALGAAGISISGVSS